ncbi:hypothetical protein RCO27_04580 [Sphingosinicella sp. LHD-64]|uniref:hypothetical protein n=1 Tax=Sphingosinicella sp. LHD-64 TaxID=3072139 RepID=UPI0028101E88|nr:hypothetical protein [Sphingosinicella sp. LHD-64]MDQ8755497.1 hypothetical protein [Sphingosinicella sp. LHD-64]
MEQHPDPPPRIPAHLLALLTFAPVPLRARRDGWTPARQRCYVLALAATGHGGRAAALARMTPQSACALRRRPGAEGFARACAAALFLAAEPPGAERGDPARKPCGHRELSDVMKLPPVLSEVEGPAPSPAEGRDAGGRSQ